MRIVRLVPIGAAAACSIGFAAPALADSSLNGHYQASVNGSRSDPLGGILLINSQCNPTGNCTGWVSTPKTWGAAISKPPGGPWTISRTDSAAWACPDGSKAPADVVYSFDAASLAGSVTATKASGACGDPAMPAKTSSLQIQKCVDNPSTGVCP
jgi:hypothetical protein